MAFQIRRGTNAERLSRVFAIGEPIYTTDNKKLYIGDATTPGGTEIGGIDYINDIGDVDLSSYEVLSVQYAALQDNVATLTTVNPHGFEVGDEIIVELNDYLYLNGEWIVNEVIDLVTFQFGGPAGTLASVLASGTVYKKGYLINDGSILSYEANSRNWVAEDRTLSNLLDVNLSSVIADSSLLKYDSTLGKWEDTSEVNPNWLTGFNISSPLSNQVLQYNGSNWINSTINLSELGDYDTTVIPSVGNLLKWDGVKWKPFSQTILKSLKVDSPVASSKHIVLFTDKEITIQEIRSLVLGATPSLQYSIVYGSDVSTSGTPIVTAEITTTNTTNGLITSSFDNGIIGANNFIWITVSAITGTVDQLFITLTFN